MYFRVNDATYWYEIYGEGETIVLLHGFTGSSSTWNHFIETMKGQMKIITIDLPGHGRTKVESPRSMETCCRDLEEFFEFIGLASFHLVGYSMGGRTALSYAMLYPKRIQSLILESASPGLDSEDERQIRIDNDEKLANRIETEGLEAFVDYWENIALFETQKDLPLDTRRLIREERLSHTAAGLAMSLRYMGTGKQPSWWKELHHFERPVLLLAGELDKKFVEMNKKMQKRFISCKLKVCEDAGHAIHVEKPDTFDRIVLAFISKNT